MDHSEYCEKRGRSENANLFRPTFDRKRPQAGREPSIKYVLILLEGERLPTRELFRALGSLFKRSSDNPTLSICTLLRISSAMCNSRGSENTYINVLSFNRYEIRRASVTPPQLAGDTPVLDATQPGIPFGFGRLGEDSKFAFSCSLGCDASKSINLFRSRKRTSQQTFIASSAKGLEFTHHWGFITGSMISLDLL